MLLTPHFLVGSLVASKTISLSTVSVAALGSHFILDAVPHKDKLGEDYLDWRNIALRVFDVAVLLVLLFIIFEVNLWIILGGVLAISPDLVEMAYKFIPGVNNINLLSRFHNWHVEKLQKRNTHIDWFWGVLPQVLVIIVVYLLV